MGTAGFLAMLKGKWEDDMDSKDVILLIDVKCPSCKRVVPYSSLVIERRGDDQFKVCSGCGYVLPELYAGEFKK